MHDEYDREEVIERLLAEIRALRETLTNVEYALSCEERTRGLSYVGGIEALRRDRNIAEKEVKILNKELDLLIKKGYR